MSSLLLPHWQRSPTLSSPLRTSTPLLQCVHLRLNEAARRKQQHPSKPSSGHTRVAPIAVAPEGIYKSYSLPSQLEMASAKKLWVFGHDWEGEEVLTVRCKTPSVRTRVVMVPGPCGPEMDYQGVPDTLPHSTSSLAQANPVSLTSERHTKVAPSEMPTATNFSYFIRIYILFQAL